MRRLVGILSVAAALSATSGFARSPAWQLVWDGQRAAAETSAVGRVHTMMTDDGRERSAIARVQSARGRVRLDYEAGERRWSMIDDGRELIRLDAAERTAVAHRRPQLAIDRATAERNYRAEIVGEEKRAPF